MLILARKVGERIRIAENIEIVVLGIQGERIKIGIEAPKSVAVRRAELPAEPRRDPQSQACLAG